MEAVSAGAHDCGYPATAAGMFSGPVELAWHAMRRATEAVGTSLEGSDMASLTPNERVKVGVQARLAFLGQFGTSWAQAMALGATPASLPTTLQLLGSAADEVWYWAGDRSTDLNWYTRRGLLVGVISATEVAMLADRSPGQEETAAFLDRRLEDVTALGRGLGNGLAGVAALAQGLQAALGTAFAAQGCPTRAGRGGA
jgi:ubiquinone biosynthesis protein COQ9